MRGAATSRVLLLAGEHPRRAGLEDLLADVRAVARPWPAVGVRGPQDLPWQGTPPDLLVVLAPAEATLQAVALVRLALVEEPLLSVLVADDPARWPEALRLLPGVAVVDPRARAELLAARERLLERRRLLLLALRRGDETEDGLAAAALCGEGAAVREMALLLERLFERRAHVVLAGETGSLRRRLLRHLLAREEAAGRDDVLFVDDLERVPPAEQGRLLALAREGRRVLATAGQGLARRFKDGSFRADLYYLLGGRPVPAPPLRERLADLPRLLAACGLAVSDQGLLAALAGYAWPGNLRELELVAAHARLLAGEGPVDARHLVLPDHGVQRLLADTFVLHVPHEGVPLETVEKELLRQTLEATDKNVTEAARRLAVNREKLRYRLRRHGLGR